MFGSSRSACGLARLKRPTTTSAEGARDTVTVMLGCAPQDRTWTRLAPRLHAYLLAIRDCGSIVCLSWVYRVPIMGLSRAYQGSIMGLSYTYRVPIVGSHPERLRRSSSPHPSASHFPSTPKPFGPTQHYGPSRTFGARLVANQWTTPHSGSSKKPNYCDSFT